jgi:hypothetical protein
VQFVFLPIPKTDFIFTHLHIYPQEPHTCYLDLNQSVNDKMVKCMYMYMSIAHCWISTVYVHVHCALLNINRGGKTVGGPLGFRMGWMPPLPSESPKVTYSPAAQGQGPIPGIGVIEWSGDSFVIHPALADPAPACSFWLYLSVFDLPTATISRSIWLYPPTLDSSLYPTSLIQKRQYSRTIGMPPLP